MSNDEYKAYRRTALSYMRPWKPGDDMTGISVSAADAKNGSPKHGDMIAMNISNDADMWLVSAEYFKANFAPLDDLVPGAPAKQQYRPQQSTKPAEVYMPGIMATLRIEAQPDPDRAHLLDAITAWRERAERAEYLLEQTAKPNPAIDDLGATYSIDHDGFTGTVIGGYVTREGKVGVCLQQLDSRVVHVYGRKWLKPVEQAK